MNVGLLSIATDEMADLRIARIFELEFVSANASPKRCSKDHPYTFKNKTFCCSRPVYFEWNKDGQCYGRSQKCPYDEGCVNYHPKCDFIDGLLGINFPLDEYNTIYNPVLIPTTEFSHRLVFKEFSKDENSENHCIWRDDMMNWIIGLCRNIDNNIGEYFIDTGFECPDIDYGWKDVKSNSSVSGIIKEIKDRTIVGRRIINSPVAGIFGSVNITELRKIHMCLEWRKIPFINQWKCSKFFPPKINSEEIDTKKEPNNPIIENKEQVIEDMKKEKAILSYESEYYEYDYSSDSEKEDVYFDLIPRKVSLELKNNSFDNKDTSEYEYDSILDDIFY